MKHSSVVVRWQEGLHLRHAAQLVCTSQKFRSRVLFKCGEKLADVRSIVSIVALCATMGTSLDIETSGEDEAEAAQAMEQVFSGANAVV